MINIHAFMVEQTNINNSLNQTSKLGEFPHLASTYSSDIRDVSIADTSIKQQVKFLSVKDNGIEVSIQLDGVAGVIASLHNSIMTYIKNTAEPVLSIIPLYATSNVNKRTVAVHGLVYKLDTVAGYTSVDAEFNTGGEHYSVRLYYSAQDLIDNYPLRSYKIIPTIDDILELQDKTFAELTTILSTVSPFQDYIDQLDFREFQPTNIRSIPVNIYSTDEVDPILFNFVILVKGPTALEPDLREAVADYIEEVPGIDINTWKTTTAKDLYKANVHYLAPLWDKVAVTSTETDPAIYGTAHRLNSLEAAIPTEAIDTVDWVKDHGEIIQLYWRNLTVVSCPEPDVVSSHLSLSALFPGYTNANPDDILVNSKIPERTEGWIKFLSLLVRAAFSDNHTAPPGIVVTTGTTGSNTYVEAEFYGITHRMLTRVA